MRFTAIIAAAILAASFASSVFADDGTPTGPQSPSTSAIELVAVSTMSHIHKPRPNCPQGKVLGQVCLKWSAPLPGKLVGGCIEPAMECVTPTYLH